MSVKNTVSKLFGTDPAGRVKKFENALAAIDERLARLNDRVAEAAAAFVESADAAPLREAESAFTAAQSERAALARGLETARKDLADEQAKAAAEAEVERQASLLKQAEALDGELRDTFRKFLECAEKSVVICGQITRGRATRFSLEGIIREVAQERARGAERVLEVRPEIFGIRIAVSPKVAANEAKFRAVVVEQGAALRASLAKGLSQAARREQESAAPTP